MAVESDCAGMFCFHRIQNLQVKDLCYVGETHNLKVRNYKCSQLHQSYAV